MNVYKNPDGKEDNKITDLPANIDSQIEEKNNEIINAAHAIVDGAMERVGDLLYRVDEIIDLINSKNNEPDHK